MDESRAEALPSVRRDRNAASFDLCAEITQQIVAMLEKGVVPWRSPILGQSKAGYPRNLESTKLYRGVNVFLLAFTAYAKGYDSAYWLTFNQAKAKGGMVKKGEKSSMVVFWKKYEVKDKETGEPKEVPVLRFYRVFNVNQCDDIVAPDAASYVPTQFEAIASAEAIAKGYADGPIVAHGGSRAYFRPSEDTVHIPEPSRFTCSAEYYSTLFHELSHSTGIKSRLGRGLDTDPKPYGNPDYGKEELVAEMSAAFLCGQAGIVPAVITNQAAYISGWLGQLKHDKRLIIQAAAAGQRAADWIRGQRNVEGQEGRSSETASTEPADASSTAVGSPIDRKTELVGTAQAYLRRGFAVVPIPAGRKGPIVPGWQNLRLTEDQLTEAFVDAGNIGILLGAPSGNLVDVDLDCPEARDLADRFLPPTAAITGRPGSPQSHRWYICPDLDTVRHRDPISQASIVELRGTGSQTLVGPSIHPSGEPYDALAGEPAQVDAKTLGGAVAQLAAEVIRLRHGETVLEQPIAPAPWQPLPAVSGDRELLLRRASAYLGSMPPAISGQGGHNVTYAAATALVHGFGLSESEAMALLQTHFNPRCQPPWTDKEMAHKVGDAATQPHTRPVGWLL